MEQAESRRRVAEAASRAQQQQQQRPNASTQSQSSTTAVAGTAPSSSLGSNLPPNHTLSAEAAEFLNSACEMAITKGKNSLLHQSSLLSFLLQWRTSGTRSGRKY